MDMRYSKVREKAILLQCQRECVRATEKELRIALHESLEYGSAVKVADFCGVTSVHFSLMRHGLRSFADFVVEKLGRLE